ncbi:mannitol dehydrogenase [Anaerolentibacter hominis]|uniref:mannitol dehydrogenase family protein n=1 Tax=Anaerolentibacter hominis TaxID=3079009 RepID=UPI0031B86728
MNSILIVGAGKEGKGFLGETYTLYGWKVSFLDKDPRVVDALKGGSYQVTVYQEDGTFVRTVTGYDAYLTDEKYECMDAVVNADVIALALYPEDIPEAAAYLGKGLTKRAEQNGKKVTIISCTNKNHIISDIGEWFENGLEQEDAKVWFRENAAVRDAIVRRSTNAENPWSLELVTQAVATLLIQQPVYADLSGLRWMELRDSLEQLKDIKIYTYNAPHATCAYAGYQKGYTHINESAADPDIAELMHQVLTEAIKGLSREFGVPEAEIWDFCTLPQTKEAMDDSIFRVAKDPVRKLGRNDRLTGNALFCLKHGIDPQALILSIANGMAYDEPKDEKAMEIQDCIRELGIEAAVAKVCGLPNDHEIVRRVARRYNEMMEKS